MIAPDGQGRGRNTHGAAPKRAGPCGDEKSDGGKRHHPTRTSQHRATRGGSEWTGKGHLRPPRKPSRAALLNKLQEQEQEQEDEDTLVNFMKN